MLSAQRLRPDDCENHNGNDDDNEVSSGTGGVCSPTSSITSAFQTRACAHDAHSRRVSSSPFPNLPPQPPPQRYLVPSAPPSLYYIPALFTAAECAKLQQQIYTCAGSPPWTTLRARRVKTLGAVVVAGGAAAAAGRRERNVDLTRRTDDDDGDMRGDNEEEGHSARKPPPAIGGVIRHPFPPWLEAVVDRVMQRSGVSWDDSGAEHDDDDDENDNDDDDKRKHQGDWLASRPNSCLINEYMVGQGIFAHRDGPAFHPLVATVSLGGTGVLELERVDGGGTVAGEGENSAQRAVSPCKVFLEPGSLLLLSGEAYEKWTHAMPACKEDYGPFANADALNEYANGERHTDDDIEAWQRRPRPREATRVSLTFRRVLGEVRRDVAADVLAKIRGRIRKTL
ncbi:Alpha-ketoglutarate-dependent dioxygenase alkB 6 [Geranomyces michiganensis]|nr:Alpha-ketoglutarate-dependent dioxygenase alkB 6 [Geranomyces michiganensis]